MKKIILFLGKILLFSLLLMPGVNWFDGVYRSILQLGVADPSTIHFAGSRAIILFFALVLATPGLTVKKRFAGILGAIVLYLLVDWGMIYLWGVLPYAQKENSVAQTFYTQVYYMFMRWLLPFLLWLFVALREAEEMLALPAQNVKC